MYVHIFSYILLNFLVPFLGRPPRGDGPVPGCLLAAGLVRAVPGGDPLTSLQPVDCTERATEEDTLSAGYGGEGPTGDESLNCLPV